MSSIYPLDWSPQFLLAILFLLPLLILLIKTKTSSSKWHHPPSPTKLPLIGNLHQLSSLLHHSLHSLSKIHGPIMLLKLGQIPTLVVSSANVAQEIMRTHDHIFASRPSLLATRIILYNCKDVVFAPHGEYWRHIRRICVINLLSTKMVQSFRHVREEEVTSMTSKILKICFNSGGVVNLTEVLNLFANNVMCKAISGKCFRDGRSDVICRLTEEMVIILAKLSVGDCFPMLRWLDVFSGFEAKARRVSQGWNEVLDEIIRDHVEEIEEVEGGRGSEEERVDFVKVLLALQKDNDLDFPLNKEIMKAILLDMIAAGTDTSFIALEWCMAELIRNSQKMKILQDEVRSIVKTEPVVREEDLSKMIYLNVVIKETLRLHPPLPLLIPHESMDRCIIQGYDIPKKTRVIINAWGIGRDPKFWESPNEFRPERFMGNPVDFEGHNFQFIPFGAGRRICPGSQFAIATIKLALANLVHQFDWKLPNGIKSEDLDMTDSPGIASRRSQSLQLIAKPFNF